jgi:hypothetical protein
MRRGEQTHVPIGNLLQYVRLKKRDAYYGTDIKVYLINKSLVERKKDSIQSTCANVSFERPTGVCFSS